MTVLFENIPLPQLQLVPKFQMCQTLSLTVIVKGVEALIGDGRLLETIKSHLERNGEPIAMALLLTSPDISFSIYR